MANVHLETAASNLNSCFGNGKREGLLTGCTSSLLVCAEENQINKTKSLGALQLLSLKKSEQWLPGAAYGEPSKYIMLNLLYI